jgi:methionyl-tRNA formyltransferase
MTISIITDKNSWINDFIPKFIEKLELKNHRIYWIHNIKNVQTGDICFLLGCSQIMSKTIMKKNSNNIVVHESDLPKGKGWSPLTWQVLGNKNKIPITLLGVDSKIDSGEIYLQELMSFEGHELIDEMRHVQSKYTFNLCLKFIDRYPSILEKGRLQEGKSSFYKRRLPINSQLMPNKTISEQFNLLRTVDNNSYPAFFFHKGEKYIIKIEKEKL